MSSTLTYGLTKAVDVSAGEAESRVRAALVEQGFGVLTEIDVRATFKAKLDVEFRPYKILGACNPSLAYRALQEEIDIGLLLPCNVVVYEGDGPETAVVSILDPVLQLGVAGRDDIVGLAEEVKSRMERVLAAV